MAVSSINTECKRYGCIKNLLACYANCRYNTRCEELKSEVTDKHEQAAKDINSYLTERGRNPIAIQFMKRGLKFTDLKKAEPSSDRKKLITAPASNLNLMAASRSTNKPMISVGTSKELQGEKRRVKSETPRKRAASRRMKLKRIKTSATNAERRAAKLSNSRSASYLEKNRAPQSKTFLSKRQPVSSSQGIETMAEPSESRRIAKKVLSKRKTVMPKKANRSANIIYAGQSTEVGPTTREMGSESNSRPKGTRQKRKSVSTGKSRSNGKLYIILDGKQASLVNERELMSHLLNNPSGGARYFEAREVEARVQIVLKP